MQSGFQAIRISGDQEKRTPLVGGVLVQDAGGRERPTRKMRAEGGGGGKQKLSFHELHDDFIEF